MNKPVHYILVIILAVIAGYIGSGFRNPGTTTMVAAAKKETAYERVLRTGTLRCGYAVWPPYVLNKDINTGEISGAAKDIIEEAAQNLSLKVEWVEEAAWGTFPEALKAGRFDVMCTPVGVFAHRAREIRFTTPAFYSPVYAYVRADDTRFDNGFDHLNDPAMRISAQDGEGSAMIAQKHFPKATLVSIQQLSDLAQIFLNVTNNKADIVFNTPDAAQGFIDKNPGKLKRVGTQPFETYSIAYSVAMNEPNLQEMLNNALLEIQNKGIIDRYLNQYDASGNLLLHPMKLYQLPEQPQS